MKNPIDIVALELQKIGLTLREAQTYLAILERKNCTTKDIMDAVGLSRPTVHRTLKNLIEKELIYENKANLRVATYIAISPDELLSLVRIRKRIVEEQERELQRIMAQLRQRDTHTQNTIMAYPNNATGERALFDRLIQTDSKEIYIFIASKHHINQEKLHAAYDTIVTRRGKSVHIYEIIAPKVSFPRHAHVTRTSLKTSSLPIGHTFIIADSTSTVTDSEIILIDVAHVTEFHRACIASCCAQT